MSLMHDGERYQDVGRALKLLVETASALPGTNAAVKIVGETKSIHPLMATNLLRVCQEALGIAQRYAGAKQVIVDLTFTSAMVRLTGEAMAGIWLTQAPLESFDIAMSQAGLTLKVRYQSERELTPIAMNLFHARE